MKTIKGLLQLCGEGDSQANLAGIFWSTKFPDPASGATTRRIICIFYEFYLLLYEKITNFLVYTNPCFAMTVLQRIEHWGDAHQATWLPVLRIALGIFLFGKGISFISDTTKVAELMSGAKFDLWSTIGIHYVAFSHIFGGFLIAMGTFTRTACLFQIPILLGAVFFVNLRNGFSYLNSELWLSLVALVLVVLFGIAGSGRFSMDEWMERHSH